MEFTVAVHWIFVFWQPKKKYFIAEVTDEMKTFQFYWNMCSTLNVDIVFFFSLIDKLLLYFPFIVKVISHRIKKIIFFGRNDAFFFVWKKLHCQKHWEQFLFIFCLGLTFSEDVFFSTVGQQWSFYLSKAFLT